MLLSILVWYSAFQLAVSVPTVLHEDIREMSCFNNSVFQKLVVALKLFSMYRNGNKTIYKVYIKILLFLGETSLLCIIQLLIKV
jgi:hypothetical protein